MYPHLTASYSPFSFPCSFDAYSHPHIKLFDSSKIFICPQPYGAGISLKLLEAISNGLPCIASPIAANSLPDGENGVLIANNELDYINAILNLNQNEELWESLRNRNLKYIETHFSYSSLHRSFKKIFSNLEQ